jgi:hypothetical protein
LDLVSQAQITTRRGFLLVTCHSGHQSERATSLISKISSWSPT